jgi:dihydroorotate dehydrogenase (fumarate)
MADLTTTFMGINLKNPIIIGSSGLTSTIDQIKKLESNGAAAVVLKSIFEEQIRMESDLVKSDTYGHTEEEDYILQYTKIHNINEYLKLIKMAKKETSIPIIASINCSSSKEWITFSKTIQDSGADALELNLFIIPGDTKQTGGDVEQVYLDIVNKVSDYVSIPISLKLSFYFSGLANMMFNLSIRKISGIVLFNRFYSPDIDLDKEALISTKVFSSPEENSLPLRWIGMLSGKIKCDLASSTGIHDGYSIAKNLLAGAKAVEIVSAIYKKGPEYIGEMLNQLNGWMNSHKYKSVKEIIGKLDQTHIKDPILYERSQFMKYFSELK